MSRKILIAFLAIGTLVFLLAACTPIEFSPDGKRIIFCWSSDGKSSSLFTMNTDGSQLKALPGGDDGLIARWSPDSKAILFADAQDNLKVYDTETSKVTTLGSKASLAFAWKEDSRQIAALHIPQKNTLELRRYRWPEGTVESRMPLPPRLTVSPFSQMTWVRGREDVAFIATDANHHAFVYIVSDAGVRKPLLSSNAVGLGTTSDRKNLIWACPGANLARELVTLYQCETATGRVTRLPFPAHLAPINSDASRLPATLESVAFDPEGKWMAMVVDQQAPKGTGNAKTEFSDAVYVARMDGTAAHLVQQVTVATPQDAPDMKEDLIPSWSHDGSKLAVLQWGHSHTSISLYNADGSGRVMLPLPAHSDDAMVRRVQAYVSRHYPRSLERSRALRRPTGRH